MKKLEKTIIHSLYVTNKALLHIIIFLFAIPQNYMTCLSYNLYHNNYMNC